MKANDVGYYNGIPCTILSIVGDHANIECDAAHIIRYPYLSGKQFMCVAIEDIDKAELLTLEDISIKGGMFSPYGHIIDKCGTVYALTRAYTHGMICALLYPSIASEKGYRQPDRDSDDCYYQNFELDNSGDLPVIRISHNDNLSKSSKYSCTEDQVNAVYMVLNSNGISGTGKVRMDYCDVALKDLDLVLTVTEKKEYSVLVEPTRTGFGDN